MTVVQIQYALAVAEYKNFSKAAESLYISQPALSLQIKALENELQTTLFIRTPQGVSLTPAGQAFYKEAVAFMGTWQQFVHKVTGQRDEHLRHLRVGVGPRALSNGVFNKAMEFYNSYPLADVTFITMDLDGDVVKALAEKKLDLAIDRLPPSPLRDAIPMEEYTVIELLQERQCVLMSPHCQESKLAAMTLHDLQGCRTITGPDGSTDHKAMNKVLTDREITVTSLYRADNINIMMDLIRNGEGVTIGPESFAEYFRVAAVLVVPEKYISLNLMCLKGEETRPHFIALRDCLLQFTAEKRSLAALSTGMQKPDQTAGSAHE